MAKALFFANAPWATTGYGIQGKHLVPRLQKLGHELAYFAFYGLQGGVIVYDGVPIYPVGDDPWGRDILPAHMGHFGADVLITLVDIWVRDFGASAKKEGWRWLPWLPVDHEPVPPIVVEKLEHAHVVLPYSRFGERELKHAGMTNVQYVPHGVSEVYKPMDKTTARRKMKLPEDAFIIGMVAANKSMPSRKAFSEQIAAFARFKANHPEAMLYLHTRMDRGHGGADIGGLIDHYGLGDAVRHTNQYGYAIGLSEQQMAVMYNSFDLLTSVSYAEGFGIPIIEAQACGVPVVTGNWTSMPELTFAGIAVENGFPMWTPLNSYVFIPYPDAILDAYEQMYTRLNHADTAAELRQTAIEGVKPFSWDRIVEDYWKPVMAALDEPQLITMPSPAEQVFA